MKPLLIVIVAAVLAVSCSGTEPPQTAQPAASAAPPSAAQPSAAPVVPTEPPPAAAPSTQPTAPAQDPAPARAAATPTGAPAAATAANAPTTAPATAPAAAPAPPPPPPPKPVEPPAPVFRELTVPAGTELSVTVLSTLGSTTSKVEDLVRGALAAPVMISGTTALPKGAEMRGTITDVKQSGRVKGQATLAFRFDRLMVGDESHRIQTARVTFDAEDKKSDDVKKGGLGAGLGAAVGGIAGGGKGAAIGAIAGGTTAVMATKGREVEIAPGTPVTVLLQEPLTVRVRVK